MAIEPKKDFNAETLINEHGKDISGLVDKVTKCYSSERYEEFQGAVEKITLRYIKSQMAWAVLIWLVTLIVSMIVEKIFKVF